jgi:hypothetical protein
MTPIPIASGLLLSASKRSVIFTAKAPFVDQEICVRTDYWLKLRNHNTHFTVFNDADVFCRPPRTSACGDGRTAPAVTISATVR